MTTTTPFKNLPDFRDADHLLPVIAQDINTNRVLMLAWMNRAAFDETVRSQVAVYFSRSRGRLWRKGETSGHAQRIQQILVDCDADTILLRVEQEGAACHNGFASCFYRALDENKEWQQIESPAFDPNEIYTTPTNQDGTDGDVSV